MPNAWASIAVAAILSFSTGWNAFMRPLIYLNAPRTYTRSIALAGLLARHSGATPWNVRMAAAACTLAPLALVVLAGRRRLLAGLVTSASVGRWARHVRPRAGRCVPW